MSSEFSDKVSWNISQGLLIDISNTLAHANNYYLRGNTSKWFYYLKAVKMRVIQSLKPDERKEFSSKESKITNSNPLKDNVSLLIEEYNELLMDKLNKYGYLIRPELDSTKMF